MKYILTAAISIGVSLFLSAYLLKLIYERTIDWLVEIWKAIEVIASRMKDR